MGIFPLPSEQTLLNFDTYAEQQSSPLPRPKQKSAPMKDRRSSRWLYLDFPSHSPLDTFLHAPALSFIFNSKNANYVGFFLVNVLRKFKVKF